LVAEVCAVALLRFTLYNNTFVVDPQPINFTMNWATKTAWHAIEATFWRRDNYAKYFAFPGSKLYFL